MTLDVQVRNSNPPSSYTEFLNKVNKFTGDFLATCPPPKLSWMTSCTLRESVANLKSLNSVLVGGAIGYCQESLIAAYDNMLKLEAPKKILWMLSSNVFSLILFIIPSDKQDVYCKEGIEDKYVDSSSCTRYELRPEDVPGHQKYSFPTQISIQNSRAKPYLSDQQYSKISRTVGETVKSIKFLCTQLFKDIIQGMNDADHKLLQTGTDYILHDHNNMPTESISSSTAVITSYDYNNRGLITMLLSIVSDKNFLSDLIISTGIITAFNLLHFLFSSALTSFSDVTEKANHQHKATVTALGSAISNATSQIIERSSMGKTIEKITQKALLKAAQSNQIDSEALFKFIIEHQNTLKEYFKYTSEPSTSLSATPKDKAIKIISDIFTHLLPKAEDHVPSNDQKNPDNSPKPEQGKQHTKLLTVPEGEKSMEKQGYEKIHTFRSLKGKKNVDLYIAKNALPTDDRQVQRLNELKGHGATSSDQLLKKTHDNRICVLVQDDNHEHYKIAFRTNPNDPWSYIKQNSDFDGIRQITAKAENQETLTYAIIIG